jgi:hypothetical protein
MSNDRHNIKTGKELEIITTVELSDHEVDKLLSVAIALSGVRMDLEIQQILDIVVEMYNAGHAFDEIGLVILGASKAPAEQGVHESGQEKTPV